MTIHIKWTEHALDRICERFSGEGWRVVPYKKMISTSKSVGQGESFKIKRGSVNYVCRKFSKSILIVTVYKD